MIMYYKDYVFPIIWKSLMSKDMWYSMEPAKITATIPLEIYQPIRMSILNVIKQNKREKCIIYNDKGYFECTLHISRATKLTENKNEVKIMLQVDAECDEIEDKSLIRELVLKTLGI
jgi:hypothetical protein